MAAIPRPPAPSATTRAIEKAIAIEECLGTGTSTGITDDAGVSAWASSGFSVQVSTFSFSFSFGFSFGLWFLFWFWFWFGPGSRCVAQEREAEQEPNRT